jgi:hypothetical protein
VPESDCRGCVARARKGAGRYLPPLARLIFRQSDLDVHQGRFFSLQIVKGRFYGGCLGVVDSH